MDTQTNQLQSQLNDLQYKFKNHQHDNKSGGFRVKITDLSNYQNFYAINQVQLTPTLINTLFTQYQVLVPAQGINNVIIVEGITARINYGGTAYTGTHNLEFRYTNASGAKVTADMANTFINSATSAFDHVAGVTTELAVLANTPIVVAVPTANPATGNSNITFVTKYRIINLI